MFCNSQNTRLHSKTSHYMLRTSFFPSAPPWINICCLMAYYNEKHHMQPTNDRNRHHVKPSLWLVEMLQVFASCPMITPCGWDGRVMKFVAQWNKCFLRSKKTVGGKNGSMKNATTMLLYTHFWVRGHIDGLVQDYSFSIANALELLQSCTKPSTYSSLPI